MTGPDSNSQAFPDRRSAAQGEPSHAAEIDDLLPRMRSGDREAAAAFITRYGSRIRRRIQGKLSPAMRRIFDSQDILSTVGRRLDLYVRSGSLEANSENQLWKLLFKMANNAVVDKARVMRRLREVEDEDSPFAYAMLQKLNRAESRGLDAAEIEIETARNHLTDPVDRRILSLWLVGMPHAAIAEDVSMTAVNVRKRWQKIKERLQHRFGSELQD
jgi:DNA-directed RNA polymerase specialized sigma24 family protein